MKGKIHTRVADSGETIYIYQNEMGKKIPLNSLYSPKLEAERFLEKYKNEKKVLVLIGIGNGALIKEWIKYESFYHIHIIEPYSDIRLDGEIEMIVKENPRVTFEYFEEFRLTTVQLRGVLNQYLGIETEILIHPHYSKTDIDLIKGLLNKIQQSVKILTINSNTILAYSRDWIVEPLLNLEYSPGLTKIDELKDKFAGEKAVLVASGPSLRENIEAVRKLGHSAYIFAAGSSANGLLNQGVTPDFVTSFDASVRNYEAHFKDSPYRGPLIVGSIVNADILKEHKGDAIFCLEAIDDVSRMSLSGMKPFPVLPSVALFTLQMIYFLGFSEVYLVGQDLALSEGKYYAEGVHEHAGMQNTKIELHVESNSGELVGTTHALNTFLETLVNLIQSMDKNKIKIFNLSKYGAKIEGAPYMSPEEIEYSGERKRVDLKLKPKASSQEGLQRAYELLTRLRRFAFETKKVKRKLRRYKGEDRNYNVEDLKLINQVITDLREHEVYEEIIVPQLPLTLNQIVNFFKYTLDKESITKEDIKDMVSKVQEMVDMTNVFLDKIIRDTRIKEYYKRLDQNFKISLDR